MFAFAAVSPGLGLPAPNEVPHTLPPQTDLLATLAILILGLLLAAAAIRTVCKRE
jgi:hypothetical protein